MIIETPDINEVIDLILPIDTVFKEEKHSITNWVSENRNNTIQNNELLNKDGDEALVEVLKVFLPDLFARSMRGETVNNLHRNFQRYLSIKIKSADINEFSLIFEGYRWGEKVGLVTLERICKIFSNKPYNWNLRTYFDEAERNYEDNFQDDPLLKVKYISYKVRDLALSCFNKNYTAFDVHIPRVITRLGLLNYGFKLFPEYSRSIEIGTNPSDTRQYLFLHRLFLLLSEQTENKYSLADLDRMFWHFGRTVCKSRPICDHCPVNSICPSAE